MLRAVVDATHALDLVIESPFIHIRFGALLRLVAALHHELHFRNHGSNNHQNQEYGDPHESSHDLRRFLPRKP